MHKKSSLHHSKSHSEVIESREPKRCVAIVGAGFSGLTAAWFLRKAGFAVEVFEASNRTGGLISTLQSPFGSVETAANGFLNSSAVEELFADLQLAMAKTEKAARKRFIFKSMQVGDHRVLSPKRWPLDWLASCKLFLFIIKVWLRRVSVQPRPSESIRTWCSRVMSPSASADLVEPALQGIYAGDPRRLSARLIFGPLLSVSNRPSRSKVARRRPHSRGTVAPAGGMQKLIETLTHELHRRGVAIHLNKALAADEIARLAQTKPVVISTSAFDAAKLVSEILPHRASLLKTIESLPIITATLFFKETDAKTKGFGCLFPPRDDSYFLGVLKNDFIFRHAQAAHDRFSENWILGGAACRNQPMFDSLFSRSDEEIVAKICAERTKRFGIESHCDGAVITRWPQALPHYTVELEAILNDLPEHEQNVFLVGNYLGQIGLSKILERTKVIPSRIESLGQWSNLQ